MKCTFVLEVTHPFVVGEPLRLAFGDAAPEVVVEGELGQAGLELLLGDEEALPSVDGEEKLEETHLERLQLFDQFAAHLNLFVLPLAHLPHPPLQLPHKVTPLHTHHLHLLPPSRRSHRVHDTPEVILHLLGCTPMQHPRVLAEIFQVYSGHFGEDVLEGLGFVLDAEGELVEEGDRVDLDLEAVAVDYGSEKVHDVVHRETELFLLHQHGLPLL